MWKDLNDYWADQRCIECDRHLDRRGHLCSDCMTKRQEVIEREDQVIVNKEPVDAWKFLDGQFQKVFGAKAK